MESNLMGEDVIDEIVEDAYDTDDVIDSVRRRLRHLSVGPVDAVAFSRGSVEASNQDSRILLKTLEENSEMLPPLQLPSGSPQFSYRGVLPSTYSLRSPGGDNIDSSVHSLESTREAMRGDSVLFLQNFLDKKNLEKSPSFLMLTVYKNGEHFYTSMTLRDLLKLVQQEVAPLCKASFTHDDDVMAVGQAKYRDIRRLESILSAHEEPAILVRHHVVLMLLDPIRAIVLTDKMIVVIPDGADFMIANLTNVLNSQQQADENQDENSGTERLSETINNAKVPFEIRAYEAILDTVNRMHRQDYNRIHENIRKSLMKLKQRAIIPAELQEKMRSLKNSMSSVAARVSAHRRALDELLDHDAEMAVMNITKLKKKPTLYRMPLGLEIMSYHDDIEVLIDSSLIDTTSLETEFELLKEEIRGAEESVLLRLDTSRNQLLIANTQIAVCGTFAAGGSFIASLFGMNLVNHHEEEDSWWLYVTVLTVGFMAFGTAVTFMFLRKSGVIPTES